ncbi:hypothetical protein AX14_011190 [Amanita brunnescens Koide BX004]|nr:hypothetical protein AX14_011190 [Amanita brunnescens Koide BX004]
MSSLLYLQLQYAWHGLSDSFKWNIVVSAVVDDAELRGNVIKSFVVNLLSLTFIYALDLFLLPLVQHHPNWFHRNIGWFYQALWLFPVMSVSLYLNSLWCSTIAQRTYLLKHGPSAPTLTRDSTRNYLGILNALTNSTYRIVMIFTCLVSSFVLRFIPYIGPLASFVFLCWVDSYYCFEFVWIAKGMSPVKRIRHIEERWAYYFAFGLPVTMLCTWGTGLANAACFALIFPVYIILAMHADPVPLKPYSREPGTMLPIRLPIFAAVLWLNNKMVNILSITSSCQSNGSTYPSGLSKDFSDEADSIEEGTQATCVPRYPASYGSETSNGSANSYKQTTGRVVIRRKLD